MNRRFIAVMLWLMFIAATDWQFFSNDEGRQAALRTAKHMLPGAINGAIVGLVFGCIVVLPPMISRAVKKRRDRQLSLPFHKM